MYYQILPERVIKDCAAAIRDSEPENSFDLVLEEGLKFKEAMLTPIYLLHENKTITVTSKQMIEKKFH